MKTIHYYIVSLALAFTVASCSDDMETPNHPANTGDEVQFGAALSGVDTRTVYGDETTTGFPIYWVQGDKVKVASPQCGVKQAEYSVSVASETQNYATSLNKTGAAGIQWGTSETADFYSIYPSDGAVLNIQGNNVTATLQVNPTQYATSADKTTGGKTYIYAQPTDMGNVVMYAKTADVAKSAEAVVLNYKPFSTVIEFEITAPKQNSAGTQSEITVQSLTLTAPTGTTIAGDFTFNFPESDNSTPTIAAATGGSNAITLHFLENNQYNTVLSTGKNMMKAKMCLMPVSGVSSLEGWTVAVNTSAGTFSKTLTGQTGGLKPGMVHKLKLPQLSYASDEWVYSKDSWITSLPDYKNIYLSEVSLPGAWYAGSSESYQATADFTTLWNAGVRAFAVETKTTTNRSTPPTGIAVSGTGDNSLTSFNSGTNSLHSTEGSDGKVYSSGTAISTIINNIAAAVKQDEYAVLVLSYADGGESGRRYVDYGAWLQLLYGTFNSLSTDVKAKIHQNEITPNTTINDVLGKLIIKINVDANIAKSGSVSWWSWGTQTANYSYGNNLPALFSYNPFVQQIKSEGYSFSTPYYSNMYWMSWEDSYRNYYKSMQGNFVWCFSCANRTQLNSGTDTNIPHYKDRQNALQAMCEKSKEIYDASTHNVWFYFNAGGTQATSIDSDSPSPTKFAEVMNEWLLNSINNKIKNSEPSPLGIVMFNQCTGDNASYHGTDIIKAIIEMNSMFYLEHAGDDSGSTESEVQSAAPGYSSGMVDNNTNAFGWE